MPPDARGTTTMMTFCLCPGFWQFSVASNAHPVCLNLGVGRGKNKDCAPLHGADGRAAYGR